MAGAADTILGIGQQQARSMEFLSNAISNGFSIMSKAEKDRGDAHEQIFRSALQYKQQEIDTFFKQKQLELAGKELELDSTYKAGMLDYNMKSLDANLEEARIRAEAKEKGKENSVYLAAESKFLANTKASANISELRLNQINKNIEAERLKAQNSPALFKSASENISKLESEKIKLEEELIGHVAKISNHSSNIEAIQNGVDPKDLRLDNFGAPEQNRTISLFGGDDPQSRAFYNNIGLDFPSASDVNKSTTSTTGDNNKTIIPPAIIKASQPSKPVNELTFSEVMSFSEHKDEQVFLKARSLANPEAKEQFNKLIKSKELQSLLSFAQTKNINSSSDKKADNPIAQDVLKKAQEDYVRFGGDENELARKYNEVNTLIDSISQASKDSSDPETVRLYNATRDDQENIIPAKVNSLINSKINELTKAPEPESVFKSGEMDFGKLIGTSGKTLKSGSNKNIKVPFLNATKDKKELPFTKNGNRVPYRSNDEDFVIPKKLEEDPRKSRDQEVEVAFNNEFIRDGKIDKKKFALWAQEKFSNEQLGIAYAFFNNSGDQVLKDNEMINQEREDKIRKIYQDKNSAMKLFASQYGK